MLSSVSMIRIRLRIEENTYHWFESIYPWAICVFKQSRR